MLQRFSHVMMYVEDLDRAVSWYGEKLGFEPVLVAGPHYAILRHPGIDCRLDLHPTEAGGRDVGYGPIPNFVVEDLDAALAELAGKGVKTGPARREGDSPRFATIWDSEGNAVGLAEPE